MPAITVAPVSERSHASFAAEARKEKNSHTPELNDTAYKESTNELYQTLRPMFLTMKVFGVYYLDGASLGKGLLARVSFGYSVAVLIMMLGNLAMDMALVAGFRTLDDIVVRGAFRVLDIYIASHCVVMFLNCLRKNAWREFFMMYHVVQDGDWFVDDHNHRQLKKRVYVYVAICWAAILCNIGFGTYFVFWTNLSQHLIFNVSKDNVQLMIAKCFFTMILVYISAVWIIPIALLVVINDLLATIFKVFNEKLAQRVKDCPMNLCDCIGQLRDKHQDLTNLTLTADTLLAGLAGMAIVFNVMIICCFSYAMIYNPFNFSDPLITVGQVFWLVTSLLIIFMSTITCSCVNGEVSMVNCLTILLNVYLFF